MTNNAPKKVLLHACCGPCSLEPARILREQGCDLTIYYANSNIAPESEYARRLDTLKSWAQSEKIPVVEGEYSPSSWENSAGRIGDAVYKEFGLVADEHAAAFAETQLAQPDAVHLAKAQSNCSTAVQSGQSAANQPDANQAAATPSAQLANTQPTKPAATQSAQSIPLASLSVGNTSEEARAARKARCQACYRLRFEEAAQYAASHNFDALATTLSVSPYQYTHLIEEELERAADQAKIESAFADYRPFYREATRISRSLEMYRQNFCGCRFSFEEAQAERDVRKEMRKRAKQAKRLAKELAQ